MAERDEGDLLTGEDRAFARAMRDAREARGWSQADFARELAGRGFALTQVTISRVEQMKRAARLGEAMAIADTFGVPLSTMTAPHAAVAMLADVLDRPREAFAAMEQFRIAAARVGYLWHDLHRDVGYAQRLRSELAETGELDDEVKAMFDEHQTTVDRLLRFDPVVDAKQAMVDPDAIAELTTWRMREE